MIKTTNSTFCFQLEWTWSSFKVTVLWEDKNFHAHFLVTFGWMCYATTACLLKLMLNLFCMIDMLARALYLGDFIKYTFNTFNIGLHSNYHEQTFVVKLGAMLDMTKLFSFIPVWIVKKSCKCSEYGSFEHLLILFVWVLFLCIVWRQTYWLKGHKMPSISHQLFYTHRCFVVYLHCNTDCKLGHQQL